MDAYVCSYEPEYFQNLKFEMFVDHWRPRGQDWVNVVFIGVGLTWGRSSYGEGGTLCWKCEWSIVGGNSRY